MSKILITGGAGFIGSHLVDHLIKNDQEVIVLDNLSQGNKLSKCALDNVQLIEGDICDETLINKISRGCKYIYHFAAVLGVEVVSENHKKTNNFGRGLKKSMPPHRTHRITPARKYTKSEKI